MTQDDKRVAKWLKLIILTIFLTGFLIGLIIGLNRSSGKESCLKDNMISAHNSPLIVSEKIISIITAYNTVIEQTAGDPCISASGDNICGMKNIAACPRRIELGTWINIDGEYYQCLDRLASKYDNRFDICFDKDLEGAIEFGKQYKEIIIFR